MNVDKLAQALITQNLQIAVVVAQFEEKYPGKTIADVILEGIFR